MDPGLRRDDVLAAAAAMPRAFLRLFGADALFRLSMVAPNRLVRAGGRPGLGWAPAGGRLLAVKILHVIGDLAPVSGGPAKACFEMARAVARCGYCLAIYITDFG